MKATVATSNVVINPLDEDDDASGPEVIQYICTLVLGLSNRFFSKSCY
jgi:hypothetical protein